jgi:2-dehydro-3-deoxy-D-arabinonate dehydratase
MDAPRSALSGRRLVRVREGDGPARGGVVDDREILLLPHADLLAVLAAGALPEPEGRVALEDAETLRPRAPWRLLAPLDPPEVWAAGVTYEMSRDARVAESEVKDVYERVYDAERPELFLKDAASRRTVGPGEPIGVRSDSRWTVPEPEVALVLGTDDEPLAVTVGNDVSSRDIEGANPLYLPQAKVYAGACAIGPALVVPEDWTAPLPIALRISDPEGTEVFAGETSTGSMRRSFSELVAWARRENPIPAGSVLLTGTGLVPPDDVTLHPGYVVEVHVGGVGRLVNPVARAATLLQGREHG